MTTGTGACRKQIVKQLMTDFEQGFLTDSKGRPIEKPEVARRVADQEAEELCQAVACSSKVASMSRTRQEEYGRVQSMRRLGTLLEKTPVCDILSRVDLTSFKADKRYYEKHVFPLFQMLASVSYQTNVGAELQLLFPEVVRLTRKTKGVSLLPRKGLVFFDHVKIGHTLSPSATMLFIPNGRWCDIVVAVRGTKHRSDILADLRFWPRDLVMLNADTLRELIGKERDPKVHGGFGNYHVKLYAVLMPRICQTMALFPNYKQAAFRFFLTGHSMGSLATVLGLTFADAFGSRVFSFSYGAPLLGNQELNELLSHPKLHMKRSFRIFNRGDIFPRLPGVDRKEHLDEYFQRVAKQHKKEIVGLDYQSRLQQATGKHVKSLYVLSRLKFLHSNFSYDGKHVFTM